MSHPGSHCRGWCPGSSPTGCYARSGTASTSTRRRRLDRFAAEAAAHVRAGTLASLQTVLGDAGVLNNFTVDMATCVYPRRRGLPFSTFDVAFETVTFRFSGLPAAIRQAGDEDDRLPLSDSSRVTPKAALIHWIWLARHSDMPSPPAELDLDALDLDRPARLAEASEVSEPAADLVSAAKALGEDLEADSNDASVLGF